MSKDNEMAYLPYQGSSHDKHGETTLGISENNDITLKNEITL